MILLALLPAGCGGLPVDDAADRARYSDALRTGECASVHDVALADDCWIAAASRRPGRSADLATRTALCARVITDRDRGECYFAVAELYGAPQLCPQAVPFADDCALHVVSMRFARASTLTEEYATTQITTAGLKADDPRPWSAYFREVLGREQPLDRTLCSSQSPPLQEACRQTGLALFEDRLNQARDHRQFTCVGSKAQPPWPERVAWAPDPELDAVFTARSDLCMPLDVPR